MAQTIEHKIGDTLVARGICRDPAGVPVDLATNEVEVASAVKGYDRLFPVTVTPVPDQVAFPGAFDLAAATDGWPVGLLSWDIQCTQHGVVISSETLQLRTLPDVTP